MTINPNINYIMNKYNLGNITKIELLNSSQNKVYKVFTTNNIYVIKEYSKDAIKNNYQLRKRKEQIRISKILNENGIKTILPLTINNKYFIFFKGKYYIIYNYIAKNTLNEIELTTKHIKILAKTQSKIHKLNIESNLSKTYKKININFNKYLKIAKKKDDKLFELLNNNKTKLLKLIENCNKYINNVSDNLCISHNDYKLLNVMWNNGEVILLDFDATGLANPTCCLCESAFTFSKKDNTINYDLYYEYLKNYFLDYGCIKEDFKECLYVCLNGKLQWLQYMLSKNNKKKDNYIKETIDMINELTLYYNNIEKFYNIYLIAEDVNRE